MVKEFKVGNHYRLRQDYPYWFTLGRNIVLENRNTYWAGMKNKILNERLIWRKCVRVGNRNSDNSVEAEFEGVENGLWYYHPEDFDELETDNDKNINNESCENKIKNGGSKMELKEVKKENAKEALKQYNEEKANEEIEFAKKSLRSLNDSINRCDRDIQKLQDEKKTYTDKLSELKA